MKHHGLLLSGPMVCARIKCTKTQTRRAITLHNSNIDGNGSRVPDGLKWENFDLYNSIIDKGPSPAGNAGPYLKTPLIIKVGMENTRHRIYPRIQVGDTIYWKETHAETDSDAGPIIAYRAGGTMMHCAMGEKHNGTWQDYICPGAVDKNTFQVEAWKPSIFMHAWKARFNDTVVAVRPERLLSITDADCMAEGIAVISLDEGRTWKYGIPDADGLPGTDDHGWPWREWCNTPREAYFKLWNKINGKGAAALNPWVWAITFTHGGILEIPAAK